MSLTPDEVKHIAKLARIGISEEEVAHFQEQLSNILTYFKIMDQANIDGVPATMHTLASHNVLREDDPAPSMEVDEALANAPKRDRDQFRVRAVLE